MIAPRLLSHYLILMAVLANAHPRLDGAQPAKSSARLTLEDVVKLSQSGLSEELIITKVKQNAKVFDLSAEELLDLKKAGVTDNVINYLLDPARPYAPPPPAAGPDPSPARPPKPSAPAKQYPEDRLAARVPWEPGLYHFPQDAPVGVDIKLLLGEVEGPGLGKVLKMKGRTIAYLVGAAARTRIKDPAPLFYMRLPEGKGIEEVVLVAFEKKKARREIDMGPGPKQELKGAAMRRFDSLEVGPRLFKLTVGKLAKGEYIFFLLGSAEPPKGSQGKGYDFGIGEP